MWSRTSCEEEERLSGVAIVHECQNISTDFYMIARPKLLQQERSSCPEDCGTGNLRRCAALASFKGFRGAILA